MTEVIHAREGTNEFHSSGGGLLSARAREMWDGRPSSNYPCSSPQKRSWWRLPSLTDRYAVCCLQALRIQRPSARGVDMASEMRKRAPCVSHQRAKHDQQRACRGHSLRSWLLTNTGNSGEHGCQAIPQRAQPGSITGGGKQVLCR